MKRVKVVIPVYSERLSENEWLSLEHNTEVLKRHPIVLLLPRSLSIEAVARRFPTVCNHEIIRVSDGYLGKAGILGYNRMMLSAEFYDLFVDCEYILICQTDAWVFRDELEQWCDEVNGIITSEYGPTRPRFSCRRSSRSRHGGRGPYRDEGHRRCSPYYPPCW